MIQDGALGTATPMRQRGAAPMVWINGQRMSADAPHLSALDRGFTLADGVFETMRVYDSHVFRLDAHIRRLSDATSALGIPLPAEMGNVVRQAVLEAAATGTRDASVRVTVSRGVGSPGLAPSPSSEPTVVVTVGPLPAFSPDLYANGITVHVASGRRNERAMTAGLKTIAFTESVVALAAAHAAGADDALFLDTEGHVSEGTSSNVFVVATADANVLVTPPLSCGALPGITRATVIELATGLGIGVDVRPIDSDELFASPEVFLTSSLRAIAPVVRIDGRSIGDGKPGPLTRRAMDAYTTLVTRECRE
jgi:branched-chain amino acid aminotransferase